MNYVNVDRATPMLLPMDMRDWVAANDSVHFILEAVEHVELHHFKLKQTRSGKAQYPPRMMLALLIYCYSHGIFSSRKIEGATYRDIYVRYLTADTHPDHDTICSWRNANEKAISTCFVEVLKLARELKLLKLGTIAIDGTHIRANASKDKNLTYERAEQLDTLLEQDIEALMQKAKQADQQNESNDELPEQIARRDKLREKVSQAKRDIEARAKAKARDGQAAYLQKQAAHEKRNAGGGRPQGSPPKPPSDKPKAKDQSNLTDADSRLMRKGHNGAYTQSYNAQASVDAEGSQLIVSAHISQCAADTPELEAGIDNIPAELGPPQKALADSGYVDGDAFRRIEARNIDLYVSVQNEATHKQRRYDYRPDSARNKPAKKINDPLLLDMRKKLRTEAGQEIYSKRQQSVEPAFGIIKDAMGFRQFLHRGLAKVQNEWKLVCLAYNCKRLFNLIGQAKAV